MENKTQELGLCLKLRGFPTTKNEAIELFTGSGGLILPKAFTHPVHHLSLKRLLTHFRRVFKSA